MIKKNRLEGEGRVKDKLTELMGYYEELLEDLPKEDEFLENRILRRGIEKSIELIADTIIDISLILISSSGFERPNDSREAIMVLEKNKVLSPQLAIKIKEFVSFRNLLVHRYGKIDLEREFNSISENHEDILGFIKEVKKLVE